MTRRRSAPLEGRVFHLELLTGHQPARQRVWSSALQPELFSGMKRSPSPRPSPPGRGRVLPAVGKCSLLGGTACRGPCYQGRQHAVPPPGRGRNEFPLIPSPLRFDAIPASHRAVAQRRRVGEWGKGEGGSRPQLHGLVSRSARNFPENCKGWLGQNAPPEGPPRYKWLGKGRFYGRIGALSKGCRNGKA